MMLDAVLSVCGRYRYRLSRIWDPELAPVVWVLLNPSTADAEKDDATIRKLIGFTRSWRIFGGLEVVNLFGFRATDPKELLRAAGAGVDVFGPANDAHVRNSVAGAGLVVCGWGSGKASVSLRSPHPPQHLVAAARARMLITESVRNNVAVTTLRLCASGAPWHPLYAPYSERLKPYLGCTVPPPF